MVYTTITMEEAGELDLQALEAEIARLQGELAGIISGYREVERREIAEEAGYLAAVADVRTRRLESLSEYKTEELKAAERLRDGMLYGIDNDHERAVGMVASRVRDFIQFKLDVLREELPEAWKLFETHQNSCAFLTEFFKPAPPSGDIYSVTLSDEPLLTPPEIERCCEEIVATPSEYNVEMNGGGEYEMRRGSDVFNVGTFAVLTTGTSNPFMGTVSGVTRKQVNFTCGDRSVEVPVAALNMGFVELKRK